MSETIYSHSSLKMTLSVIQYQNYFTHQRSMKSFQLEWQQLISCSGVCTLSFISPDLVFHELTLTMKFYW